MKHLLLALMIFSSNAYAGGKEGGGGQGLICEENGIKSIQLLDHYEASTVYSFQLTLGSAGLSYRAKINAVTARLRRLDPIMADYLDQEAATFEQNTAFLDGAALREVSDANSDVAATGNCVLKQFAINKTDPLPGEKAFIVDRTLWAMANNDTKAGLVLHELIYRLVRTKSPLEVKDSRAVRYYNAMISSELSQISADEYIAILQRLQFSRGFSVRDGGATLVCI